MVAAAPLPARPLAQQGPAAPGAGDAKLKAVAEQFEGMVLSELLAPMFEALDTDGLGGGGSGERMFRPMLVERYAQAMAKAGGLGVGNSVLAELVRLQAAGGQTTPGETTSEQAAPAEGGSHGAAR